MLCTIFCSHFPVDVAYKISDVLIGYTKFNCVENKKIHPHTVNLSHNVPNHSTVEL